MKKFICLLTAILFISSPFGSHISLAAGTPHDNDNVQNTDITQTQSNNQNNLRTSSTNFNADYQSQIYNTENGLTSLEINAIAQSREGYIYAGGYSGLYRFNGSTFEAMYFDGNINNVMTLFTDSNGYLWIGTNDNGAFRYNTSDNSITHYNTENGLASNAIRFIYEDNNNNIYISTSSFLSVLTPDNNITTYSDYPELTFIRSISVSDSGIVAGVTNSGILFFINNGFVTNDFIHLTESGSYHSCVCKSSDNTFVVGTSSGEIYKCTYKPNNVTFDFVCQADIGSISYLYYDEATGGNLICAENGLGDVKADGTYTNMCIDKFDNAVSCALIDYQGNIWFASNKQGINKLSHNPFSDILRQHDIGNRVVNSILEYDNRLYIGCDDGLLVLDNNTYKEVTLNYLSPLYDKRIRNIMKDSNNNLWFSTYGADGLVCVTPEHELINYNEKTANTMGGRFRSAIELSDGTILAASSTGLTYIKNGEVIATLGEKDGLMTSQILSLVEREDGSVLAGSDGGGIYVLKNQKVISTIDMSSGLNTLVVLRIVKCSGGYLYITSNSIYYDNSENIIKLDCFPYSNNYDVYITEKGTAWVSSSAGIYVVRESDLLANNSNYNYVLLNSLRGLDTTLTANAWNYVDSDYNYYLCCSTGIKKISLTSQALSENSYNISISSVIVDNNTSVEPVDGKYVIPANAKRILISPAILNYTLSNPIVHMYLEGFDETGITCNQSDLTEITFTNLPYGEYKFHIQVLDEQTQEITREIIIPIKKEAQFFEHTFFKLYLFTVVFFIIAFFTWLLTKSANLTVVKRQYEQIQIAKEEAIHANLAKSQFLANMSHEIRTPINTIMGMNELILREDISPEIRHHAHNIHNASTTLLSIVNDILDFSKIESGKMNIIPQEYSSAPLITDLANMLQVKAKEKNLTAVTDIDPSIPKSLLGDDVRIKQIVLNLLSNAVKYTDNGTITFTIKAKPVDNTKISLYCEVTDTGIGIKPEEINKLFESFQRLDEKRNAKIQGSGLGLNITKELLNLMGSQLQVTSIYGKGSSFFFTLVQDIINPEPIGELDLESDNNETTVYMPKFTAPDAHILIIDDNTLNLNVAQGLLKDTLIQIDTGTSGKMCLEMIKNTHYDVILLDHMMPEMDGIETLEHIKSENHLCKDTPVIILTANAIIGAKEMYLDKGFVGYISKPIIPDELENVLLKNLPKDKVNDTGSNSNSAGIVKQTSGASPTGIVKQTSDTNSAGVAKQTSGASPDAMLQNDDELLDTTTGLEYCGNLPDFYTEMLEMFIEQANQKVDDITNALSEGNIKNYMVYVHGLKSTSRMLGANPLSEQARMLEEAAKREDIDYIHNNNTALLEMYDNTVNVMKNYLNK